MRRIRLEEQTENKPGRTLEVIIRRLDFYPGDSPQVVLHTNPENE